MALVNKTQQIKANVYAELPKEILQQIFQYLSIKDLITVQHVCELWKEVTENPYTWRLAPLNVTSSDSATVQEILVSAPYLHTLVSFGHCHATDELIVTIMTHLKNLRKMHIEFHPPVSAVQLRQLVEKFTELESITVDTSAADILDSLDVLDNCPSIKEFIFYETRPKPFVPIEDLLMIRGERFSNLIGLRMSKHVLSQEYGFAHFLVRKLDKLSHLDLTCNLNRDSELFRLISNCARLQTLILSVWKPVSLYLQNMNSLKYLSYCLFCSADDSVKLFSKQRVVLPVSLEKIKYRLISDKFKYLHTGIGENIVTSLPKLKTLEFHKIPDFSIDIQLMNIETLRDLHTLKLYDCMFLSVKCLDYISQCKNLIRLSLSNISLVESSFDQLKKLIYLQELELQKCQLDLTYLQLLVKSLKYLNELSILYCYKDEVLKQYYHCSAEIYELCQRDHPRVRIKVC